MLDWIEEELMSVEPEAEAPPVREVKAAVPVKASEPKKAPEGAVPTDETGRVLTEREIEEQKKKELDWLIPKAEFSRPKFMAYPSPELGKEKFSLSGKEDWEIWKTIEYIHETLKAIPEDDPSVAQLHKWLKQHYAELEKRADKIEEQRKGRKERDRYQDDFRVLHEDEELMVALGVLDDHKILLEAALGYTVTNNGERAIEGVIPSDMDIAVVLQERVPSLPERAVKTVWRAIKVGNGRALKTAIGALGGEAAGFVTGTLLGGAVAGFPGMVVGGVTLAVAETGVGAAAGYHWDVIVGKEGEEIKIKLSFLPTESKVVSAYAKHFGVEGWTEEEIGQEYVRFERLRHTVLARAGLDLESATGLGVADLIPEGLDPQKNAYSRGASTFRLYTERQLALDERLKKEGRTWDQLSPEERLRYVLEATDTAAASLCGQELSKVVTEPERGKKEKLLDEVAEMERSADELETGTRSLARIGREQRETKVKLTETTDREGFLARQMTLLETVEQKLTQLRSAQREREVLRSTYEDATGRSSGQSALQELGEAITKLKSEIEDSNGLIDQIRDVESGYYKAARKEKFLGGEIERLTNEKPTYTEERGYSSNQIVQEHTRIDGEIKRIKETELPNAEADSSEKQAALNALKERKTRKDQELEEKKAEERRIKVEIEDAERKLAGLETTQADDVREETRILQAIKDELNLPADISYGEAKELLGKTKEEKARLERKGEELERKLTEVEARKGEASEEDKQKARAIRLVAEINRPEDIKDAKGEVIKRGKLIQITNQIATDKELDGKLADRRKGYDEWLVLNFGPNALSEEQRPFIEQILGRDLIVETAIEFWHLSDEFFAGRLKPVRERMDQIANRQDKITELETTKPTNREDQVRQLKGEMETLRKENYKALADEYKTVAHLFGLNPVKTAEFERELADRMKRKALREEPFALGSGYEIAIAEREMREIGVSRRTEDGRVLIEPGVHEVGGKIENYGVVRYLTPGHHRVAGDKETPFALETKVKGREGRPGSLQTTLTLPITQELYEALPAARDATGMVIGDWPPALVELLYPAGANARKRELDRVEEKTLRIEFEASEADGVLTRLENWADLGNLHQLYPQAVGRMIVDLDEERRKECVENFGTITVDVGAGASAESYTIARDIADGKIKVNGGPIRDKEIGEFKRDYEQRFRERQQTAGQISAVDAPLTEEQAGWLKDELARIFRDIGKEALKAMQRF